MSSISGNTTRLTGLASGMDTDSIIKNLMQIEQLKVNRELRSRTLIQWRQEQLKSVSSDIGDLRNTFLSVAGSKSMLKSGTYVRFNASTKDTSGAVSVSANSNNTASSVVINQVLKLASSAQASSTVDSATNKGNVVDGGLAEGNYIKLGDISFTNALEFDANGNFSFEINGEQFTFNKEDTLQKMLSDVSNNENAGVVLNYSRLTNGFTLQTKATGADQELTFKNITGNAFGVDGAFQLDTAGQDGSGVYKGENASVRINGVLVEQANNSFTIDGISYTLNKVTAADADPIEYTFEKDIDGAVDAIKEFIDGYNTLIKKLETMVAERKTTKEKNYTPLTDEEKSNMTEKQIEEWETIAKKGLLNNDRDIQNLLSGLRNALYETVEGVGLSAAQMGLKTGSYFSGKMGEIELDEDALRAALNKDADQVMRAFMNISSSDDPATKQAESGFIYKIQTLFDSYTTNVKDVTLDGIDRNLRSINTRIEDMETRMAALEEKYYLQFAAMEKAMAELQNQSNNLVSMLSQN